MTPTSRRDRDQLWSISKCMVSNFPNRIEVECGAAFASVGDSGFGDAASVLPINQGPRIISE